MLDFVVGDYDVVIIEDGGEFLAEFSETCWVLEEHVESIVHGDGGGVTAGVHHDGDFGDNLAPFEVVGAAVLVFH